MPHSESAQDVVYTLIYSDLARIHAERLRDEPSRFQPATRERISLGLDISDEQRAAAVRQRDVFRSAMADMFRDVDVVLTPGDAGGRTGARRRGGGGGTGPPDGTADVSVVVARRPDTGAADRRASVRNAHRCTADGRASA